MDKDKSEETYVLGKIKDIYSQAGYDTFIKIYNKDKSKFLMYHKDPQTFEKVIEEILRTYPQKNLTRRIKKFLVIHLRNIDKKMDQSGNIAEKVMVQKLKVLNTMIKYSRIIY